MYARIKDHRHALSDSAIDMLLTGVSTRRVGELLEAILAMPVPAGQVRRLASAFDAQVRRWHTRLLVDAYRYLILDAIWFKTRGPRRLLARPKRPRQARKCVVLVAYGSRCDGVRELIDFRLPGRKPDPLGRSFAWTCGDGGCTVGGWIRSPPTGTPA